MFDAFIFPAIGCVQCRYFVCTNPSCKKASAEYEEFYQLVEREFAESYEVHDYVIDQATSYDDFKSTVFKHKPELLVLLDNRSVNLAKEMYKNESASRSIKAIASMGLNLQTELFNEENIAGVGYEASGYSIVTEFRKVVDSPVKRIVLIEQAFLGK